MLVELTGKGWALRERVAHVPEELYAALHLTVDEVDQLRRLLGKVLDNLDG